MVYPTLCSSSYTTVLCDRQLVTARVSGVRRITPCINAVQNRVCQCFLGVGKFGPNSAVNGNLVGSPNCATVEICSTNLLSIK